MVCRRHTPINIRYYVPYINISIKIKLSQWSGSDRWPPLYESGALPTELHWPKIGAVDRDWTDDLVIRFDLFFLATYKRARLYIEHLVVARKLLLSVVRAQFFALRSCPCSGYWPWFEIQCERFRWHGQVLRTTNDVLYQLSYNGKWRGKKMWTFSLSPNATVESFAYNGELKW